LIIDEKSPIPKYYQLQIWLKEQIEQGVYKINDKIPTEDELVKSLDLSRATIKHAVQNLVDKGYLVRKKKLGTFVSKPSLQNGKNYQIGIVVNYYKSGFGIELIRGAGDKAIEHNCELVLCNSYDLHVQADYCADRLIEQGIMGVVYVPTAASDDKNHSIVQKFLRNRVPVVIADRVISGLEIDQVVSDNFDGAYTITKHLISHGHTKIAIVINTLLDSARQRLSGYKQALTDSQISISPDLIFASDEHYSEENSTELARVILAHKKNFTAVFAENDKMAFIICSVAEKAGIKIPEELSIVGYDDVPFIDNNSIRLTTIHQPLYEMGQNCIQLLFKRITGDISKPQTILLHSYLVDRSSVLARS
jgi:DNA-binding LacI/PurR family transcriptional regulator